MQVQRIWESDTISPRYPRNLKGLGFFHRQYFDTKIVRQLQKQTFHLKVKVGVDSSAEARRDLSVPWSPGFRRLSSLDVLSEQKHSRHFEHAGFAPSAGSCLAYGGWSSRVFHPQSLWFSSDWPPAGSQQRPTPRV